MASTTQSQGILSQLYDCIFGESKSESSSEVLLRILCTGKWREFEARRALLEAILSHPVTVLSQEDEGILQAQCAHQIMMENDFVSPTFAKCDANFTLLINATPASFPPLIPNAIIEPLPLGKSFFANS